MMNDDCKGCSTYDDCIKDYSIKDYASDENVFLNVREECPCSRCLVKVVCREGCNDWSRFRKDNKYDKYKNYSMQRVLSISNM